jgi:hypothetical protein
MGIVNPASEIYKVNGGFLVVITDTVVGSKFGTFYACLIFNLKDSFASQMCCKSQIKAK